MSGLLDHLAARVRSEGATVRPRPDVLLLAQLGPGNRAATEQTVEDDRDTPSPPPRRYRSAQPPAPPVAATAETMTAGQPAPAPRPPTPTPETRTDRTQSAPSPTPPDAADQVGRQALTALPRVRASAARTFAEPEQTVTARPPQRATDAPAAPDRARQLTSRPTSEPATTPPTQRSPTTDASPISIAARTHEPSARATADQREQSTQETPPVEVVIDRIDVRLVSAPAPPRPHTAPRPPMTLEHYLEARGQR